MTAKTLVDVVVVGGGGSGLAAASEAAQIAGKVILLEKNPQTGGSTSWSVGSITATNTPHQKKAGIVDSADAHFEDMELLNAPRGAPDNHALRRILVDNVTEAVEWLMSLGVVFMGPMPEPPHRQYRMHNVMPNSRSYAYHLTRHCRNVGVDIRLNTKSKRLVVENGRVVGVEAELPNGELHEFHGRGGVILAAGDYSNGPEFKAQFVPEAAQVDGVNPTATGDGQRMGIEVGATIVNGHLMIGPTMRFIPPTRPNLLQKLPAYKPLAQMMAWATTHVPPALLRPFVMSFLTTALGASPDLYKEGAVLINKHGQRFTDELDKPNFAVAKQPDRIAWIVLDRDIAEKFSRWPYFISTAPGVAYAYLDDYRRNRADIFHRSDSLDGLADSMGVPRENLKATLAEYNAGARQERPRLDAAPYYALGPVRSYVVVTDGGLRVTEQHEVVRADGSVIPGLYAAGATGQGGAILDGHGHHLGWAFVSGRRAGRLAAKASVAALA